MGGTLASHGRTRSVLEHARDHKRADVIRLLLDAGAPLPDRGTCAELAAIARCSGAEDLIARLLPEG